MSYMCNSCKHKNSVVCVRCKYCERYEREKMTNRKELAKLFPPMKRKPMTNYDRLVSKTPEELAEFFFKDPAHLYMKTPKETLSWLKSPVDGSE